MNRDREQQGRRGGRWFGGHRDEQDEQGRQGESRHRSFASGLRDTYNPEPQWLRDDRESGAWGRDEDEYGSRRQGGESGQGRGSYASSGREWGESQERDISGRGFSGRDVGGGTNRDFGGRDYGMRDQSRMRQEREDEERAWRAYGSGRDTRSGYGAQSRSGASDYSTGYETSGWDDQDFNEAPSRYESFRVGTGMGLGPSGGARPEFGRSYGTSSGYGEAGHGESSYGESGYGGSSYGSRAGWDLGTHQRDFVGERASRASFRGMGPQNYKRSDERIREDVCERLTDNQMIDARNITVDVNQGNVTLSGTVGERRMRYAAEDLVERIGGVANINNQLRVQQRDETQSSTRTASQSSSQSSPGGTPSGTGTSTGTGTSETPRH